MGGGWRRDRRVLGKKEVANLAQVRKDAIGKRET